MIQHKTIHLGIVTTASVETVRAACHLALDALKTRIDGDSFVEWGEEPREGEPLHVTWTTAEDNRQRVTVSNVRTLHTLLTNLLSLAGVEGRVTDLGYVTDGSDWAEDAELFSIYESRLFSLK